MARFSACSICSLTPQLFVFLLIYLSYAVSLVVKRNASFWVSGVVADRFVAADRVGVLGSLWETANGLGKILSAVVVDAASSPAVLLAAALAAQGGGGLGFLAALSLRAATPLARTTAFSTAAAFWALSGLAQSIIWPALMRIFMAWFPAPAQRGTWYAILATSQNVGAAIAPLVTDAAAQTFGWRARVAVPALIAVSFAAFILSFLPDKPSLSPSSSVYDAPPPSTPTRPRPAFSLSTLTSPAPAAVRWRSRTPSRAVAAAVASSVAAMTNHTTLVRGSPPGVGRTRSRSLAGAGNTLSPARVRRGAAAHFETPLVQSLMIQDGGGGGPGSGLLMGVFSSTPLWLLSCNYFFNSFVRNGITASVDVIFRGAPAGAASAANVAYEIGGAIGGLASGALSDAIFGSRRAPAMALFGAALIPLPLLLPHLRAAFANTTFPSTAAHTLFFLIGSTAFPPHVLNGLVSREIVRPEMMTAAAAFTKSAGQAGAALAEYLIISAVLSAEAEGPIKQALIWSQVAGALALAAAVSAAAVLPLWKLTAWVGKEKLTQ